MPKISIVKGDNRKENILKAINLIKEDIEKAIKAKKLKPLFIKINAIDSNFPLACTHIDALDAVLSLFYSKFEDIIVGDNTFVFKNKENPYRKILEKYPKVKLSDLTEFESEDIEFKKTKRISIGKISLLPRKAFTISLALPKTHDTFVYTGCLKNMFGCVIKNRGELHAASIFSRLFSNKDAKNNETRWHNLINVINRARPDLCILDGYEGMEGEGPLLGTKIEMKIAMCSLDGLALDKLASKLCGFGYVPYLNLMPNASNKIKIIKEGFNSIEEISKKFKHHYNHKHQLKNHSHALIPIPDVKFALSILNAHIELRIKF